MNVKEGSSAGNAGRALQVLVREDHSAGSGSVIGYWKRLVGSKTLGNSSNNRFKENLLQLPSKWVYAPITTIYGSSEHDSVRMEFRRAVVTQNEEGEKVDERC